MSGTGMKMKAKVGGGEPPLASAPEGPRRTPPNGGGPRNAPEEFLADRGGLSKFRNVRLGDISQAIDYGVTASASSLPIGPKFLRITDIQNGCVNWDTVPWCKMDRKDYIDSILQPGDIVFARTGATTGKTFLIKHCPDDSVFASYLIRVRLNKEADPRFIHHYFQSSGYWSQITQSARGAAQPGVNSTVLKDIRIPLPPLPEQRRIAEVLDRAEALRATRQESIKMFNDLLTALFYGSFGDPAQNSKNLSTISLGELGDWQSGGTPPRTQEHFFFGGTPWFSSGELNDIFVIKSFEHVSERALSESSAKRVPINALMLGMYDTAALKASIAKVDCSCNQAIAFSTINPSLANVIYVYFAVTIGREHFRKLQRGVRQKNLNLSLVREIRIPHPSIERQNEFACAVLKIEKIKSVHRASLAQLDALFASLQHRAFRGEL